MTRAELLEEKTELEEQLAILNATIKNVLSRTNKEYEYSNVESIHKAKTHDIKQLRADRKAIKDELAEINRQLGCSTVFTQIKS